MAWSICIFAHNEERLLPQCLSALTDAAVGGEYQVHVMENGSTDNTVKAAKAFTSVDDRIHLHELAIGDKSNAWNEYVHHTADIDADMHIFIDGDVQPSKGAFKALAMAFERNPEAYGAAALPADGRSRKAWTARLMKEHYISGNLYALSGEALRKIREQDFRFPIGAVGEDGLLTYTLLTDLKGFEDDQHRNRIAIAAGAFFEFQSLTLRPDDLVLYWGRLKRYSQRYIQNQIMYPLLKREGIGMLPDTIDTLLIESELDKVMPRRKPLDFLVDCYMLKKLSEAARRKR